MCIGSCWAAHCDFHSRLVKQGRVWAVVPHEYIVGQNGCLELSDFIETVHLDSGHVYLSCI